MKRKEIYSDAGLLNLLNHVNQQTLKTDLAIPSLPAEISSEAAELLASFSSQQDRVRTLEQSFKSANLAYRDKHAYVQRRLRLTFTLVRFAAREPDFPSALLTAFGLKVDGSFPDHMAELKYPLVVLRQVLNADVLAQEAGYFLLTGPTADEFQQHEADLLALKDARDTAEVLLNNDREQLKQTRVLAKQLVVKVGFALRQLTVGMKPLLQRNVMRAYGFSFQGDAKSTDTAEPSLDQQADVIEDDPVEQTEAIEITEVAA